MKRLLTMLAYQLLLPMLAAFLLGAVLTTLWSWAITKAAFLGVLPALVLVGTVVGYVRGRPAATTSDDPPVLRATRGLAGSLLGLLVFSGPGLALVTLALYGYGLLGHDNWFALLQDAAPPACVAGGAVGLLAGYHIAR